MNRNLIYRWTRSDFQSTPPPELPSDPPPQRPSLEGYSYDIPSTPAPWEEEEL